jgi:hypothetical protein
MNPAYQPLAPLGLRASPRPHRLFLSEDHLLAVGFDGFSEEYRRFYLRDLQGFVIRRTARRAWTNVVLGGLTFLILLPVLIPDSPAGAKLTFGLLALAPLGALVLNSVAGPTCRTWVQTAVHASELPALKRVADVERVLEQLRPRIAAAQAGLVTPTTPADAETSPAPSEP